MSDPSSLTLERAGHARVTGVRARHAGGEAVTAAAAGDRDRWEAMLQESLLRTDQSVAMAFDAYDMLVGQQGCEHLRRPSVPCST